MAAATFSVLLVLTSLKFITEDKFSPKTSGISGELAQSETELLLIGSSHTRKSYDMHVLEGRLGIPKSFLISYDGADLVSIMQIISYLATRPKHRPRFVVVEAYCAMLARKPDIQDPRLFIEAPPALKQTILQTYLSERHYSVESLLNVFDLVVNRGNDELLAFPLYSWATRIGSYKGGRTDFVFPGVSATTFRNFKSPVSSSSPDHQQVKALQELLQLLDAQKIKAIFIDTPLPGPVSRDPHVQTLKGEFKRILSARGYRYIDGDQAFPIDDPGLFSDNNHVSTLGRAQFSASVSKILASWIRNSEDHKS